MAAGALGQVDHHAPLDFFRISVQGAPQVALHADQLILDRQKSAHITSFREFDAFCFKPYLPG
jgi:hypothetical protein